MKNQEKKSKTIKLPNKKKAFLTGLVLVGVLGVVGVFVYFRKPKVPQVTNFQECVQAGNPILESLPRRCRTQEGEVFVEEIPVGKGPEPQEVCKDLCGDGICQEIVCLGSGCPCPETAESCPEDCSANP